MEIELSPDLILSHETVKKIIKKKTDHLANQIDVHDFEPNLNFIKTANGKRSKYAIIEFKNKHSILPNFTENPRVFLKIRLVKNYNNQFSIVKSLGLFYREIEIYLSVFPKILKAEDEDIVPRCFHVEKDLVLVLEDMKSKNYVTINKMRALDLSHCIVVLKCLARFHARSIIYWKLETEFPLIGYSRHFSVSEKMMITQPENYLRDYFMKIGHSLTDAFHLIRELQSLDYKKFKPIFLELVDKFFNVVSHQNFTKFRVLCHSDLVASNLLFRYNESNEPVMCCFVDFQFMKYSSPAYDLWGFFYMNTTRQMRNENMDDFFEIYHETLSEILNENQVDASFIFPYVQFKDMMRNHRVYGLVQGILNLYEELRQDLKSKYGKEYRDIMPKLWNDSSELSRENIVKYRDYKKRIIEEIVELYWMTTTTST